MCYQGLLMLRRRRPLSGERHVGTRARRARAAQAHSERVVYVTPLAFAAYELSSKLGEPTEPLRGAAEAYGAACAPLTASPSTAGSLHIERGPIEVRC